MDATSISSGNGEITKDHVDHRDSGEHVHELEQGAFPDALLSWSMEDSGEEIQSDVMDNHYAVTAATRHNIFRRSVQCSRERRSSMQRRTTFQRPPQEMPLDLSKLFNGTRNVLRAVPTLDWRPIGTTLLLLLRRSPLKNRTHYSWRIRGESRSLHGWNHLRWYLLNRGQPMEAHRFPLHLMQP